MTLLFARRADFRSSHRLMSWCLSEKTAFKMVECRRFELLASSMPLKRATNCANTPYLELIPQVRPLDKLLDIGLFTGVYSIIKAEFFLTNYLYWSRLTI